MLNVHGMKRVTMVGAKSKLKTLVEELHTLGALHIIDHKKGDIDIGSPRGAEELSEELVRLRALASHLKIDLEKIPLTKTPSRRLPKDLYEKVLAQLEEKKEVEQEIKDMEAVLRQLSVFKALKLDAQDLEEFASLDHMLGSVKTPLSKDELSELKGYDLRQEQVDGTTHLALFFAKEDRELASSLLLKHGYVELPITIDAKNVKKSLVEGKEIMRSLKGHLRAVRHTLKTEQHYAADMKATEEYLRVALEKANIPLHFGETSRAVVIKGWVPTEKMETFDSRISKAADGAVHVEFTDPSHEDSPPIKMKNRKMPRPFEFFLDMYTLPNYREVDPTFLMFLTFPFMYGFMLGDMGYGIISLGLFSLLRTKIKGPLVRFVDALLYAAMATIGWGFLFGEVFGEEVLFGIHLPHILARSHAITELLALAVLVGTVHINFGFLIGWYNEAKHHGFLHGFLAKGSWLVFQAAIVILGLTYAGLLAWPTFVGWLVLVFSLVALYKGEGIAGLVELPALFSNIFSYARLMAIGVSSVQIAIVVNTFAKPMFHGGIGGIIGGTMLLLIGHTINIALGTFGPFLHSLRLHYVEFFSKFFTGGGKPYAPFGAGEER